MNQSFDQGVQTQIEGRIQGRQKSRPVEDRKYNGLSISFISDYAFPKGSTFGGQPIGEISGFAYNKKTGELTAITDSKPAPRANIFSVQMSPQRLEISPRSVTPVTTEVSKDQSRKQSADPRYTFPTVVRDAEDIVTIRKNGAAKRFAFSTEGDFNAQPKISPGVFFASDQFTTTSSLPLPRKFEPRFDANDPKKQVSGMRGNKGFEALATTEGGHHLFTASEAPLAQDDTIPDFTKGGTTRILRYDQSENLLGKRGRWIPTREFAYQLDPIPSGSVKDPAKVTFKDNGLVGMLALDRDHIIAVERSAVIENGFARNSVRLYLVETKGASNIAGSYQLPESDKLRTVSKKLLIDLDSVQDKIQYPGPTGYKLDNFECIAWGPTLPNGNRTILLGSDDNLSATQHTTFIALELKTTR